MEQFTAKARGVSNTPDTCYLNINGDSVTLEYGEGDCYTFLQNPKINNGKLIIKKSTEYETHYDIIEAYTSLNNPADIYRIRALDIFEGRLWLLYNGEVMIMSLWEEFDKKYSPNIKGYTDSLYYDICKAMNIKPEKSYYTFHEKFFEIPTNKGSELSPLDKKWSDFSKEKGLVYTDRNGIKREMPMAQYNALRYVDENTIKYMKKNRIRLTESQLHKVIKESVKKVLSEGRYIDFCGLHNVPANRKMMNKVQNMLMRGIPREEIQDLLDARYEGQNDLNNWINN